MRAAVGSSSISSSGPPNHYAPSILLTIKVMRRLTNFSHGWLMVAEGRNSTQHVRNWCCIHRHISEFQCVLNIIGFCTRAPCSIFVNVASEAVICQILSNTMSTIVCLHQLEMNITAQTYPTISFSAEFPSGAAKPRA